LRGGKERRGKGRIRVKKRGKEEGTLPNTVAGRREKKRKNDQIQ